MNNNSWKQTTRIIVFSLLIGGLSGVLGTAITNSYLANYQLELDELTEPLRITQERPRALPENYQDALERLETLALPAVGGVFMNETNSPEGIAREQAFATAVTLTSDGWFLAEQVNVGNLVLVGNQTCEVDQIIVDPRTQLRFAHCSASSLPVVEFGNGYDLQAGDQVFMMDARQGLVATYVQEIAWSPTIVRSSDTPTRRIVPAEQDQFLSGAPVFNIFGELVGMMSVNEYSAGIVPVEYLENSFEQVLENAEEITYASLGVNAIELGHMANVDEEISRGYRTGAVLYGLVAVEPDSVAERTGLQEGDIILSVDGLTLNKTRTLADMIATKEPTTTVRVEIDRDGEQQILEIPLGSLEL